MNTNFFFCSAGQDEFCHPNPCQLILPNHAHQVLVLVTSLRGNSSEVTHNWLSNKLVSNHSKWSGGWGLSPSWLTKKNLSQKNLGWVVMISYPKNSFIKLSLLYLYATFT